MKKSSIPTVVSIAMLLTTINANAATILYVGGQSNYEAVTNDATTGWRNTTTAKPLDIDGDNIFGTDGYEFGGGTTPKSLPAYVTDFIIAGGHNDNGRGLIDNPANPTGADISGGWAGINSPTGTFATIQFTGSSLESETLRIGIIYDNNWNVSLGTQTFTLLQTVGGTATATTPSLTLANDGYDIVFFDLEGIQNGDTFQVRADETSLNSIGWLQITGITFDTVSNIPEPSAAILGGLGLLTLLRRRR